MASPYRWGDPTPVAVKEMRARRAERAQHAHEAYWASQHLEPGVTEVETSARAVEANSIVIELKATRALLQELADSLPTAAARCDAVLARMSGDLEPGIVWPSITGSPT